MHDDNFNSIRPQFVCSFLTSFTSQGILISHNASARVIRSNQSLVLQKVNRNSSGNYSCSAINAEGETVSNQLPLRVKCKCFLTLPGVWENHFRSKSIRCCCWKAFSSIVSLTVVFLERHKLITRKYRFD